MVSFSKDGCRKDCEQAKNSEGQSISESSLPTGRSLLLKMCTSLMNNGKTDCMKRRLAIATTFLAVGRSGEVACSTWTSASWDHDLGNLLMEWNEIKTGWWIVSIKIKLYTFKR